MLVSRKTYLDVLEVWLGIKYIHEAEDLKEINHRAYIHEYLGFVIGTDGDVFRNIEDMDMNEPIPRYDGYGNTIDVVPKWQTLIMFIMD